MYPTLNDGDYVLCTLGTYSYEGLHLINIDRELFVKRLQFDKIKIK